MVTQKQASFLSLGPYAYAAGVCKQAFQVKDTEINNKGGGQWAWCELLTSTQKVVNALVFPQGGEVKVIHQRVQAVLQAEEEKGQQAGKQTWHEKHGKKQTVSRQAGEELQH